MKSIAKIALTIPVDMTKNPTFSKGKLILWGLAVVAILAGLFAVGWEVFYGIVVPQANNISQFSILGLFAFAAFAGLMVNFGPCSLAVLPAYLSFHLGSETKKPELKYPLWHGLKSGFIAAIGVVSFYLLLGVALATLGTELAGYSAQIKLVIAFIIFLLGLALLLDKSPNLKVVDKFRKYVEKVTKKRSRTQSLIGFGVIYGAGGLSCFLPVFLPLVFFPFVSGAFVTSLTSFLIFSSAQGLFLIGATVAVAYGKQGMLAKLAGKTKLMKKIAGGVLILTSLIMFGVFIFLGM